jgi:hypothetical protein
VDLRLPPGLVNLEPCVISKACSLLGLAPTATVTITDIAAAATVRSRSSTELVSPQRTALTWHGFRPRPSPSSPQAPFALAAFQMAAAATSNGLANAVVRYVRVLTLRFVAALAERS